MTVAIPGLSDSLPRLAEAGLATLLAWVLLWALIPLLRQRLLDQPNARSSHQIPTPRGGGIAFVLVGSLLSAWMGTGATAWIPLLCAPLAVVGMVDDRYDLPAALRYAVQLATAVALVAITPLPLPLWFLPVVVVAVTAVINFFNFMDGLDGLVALCGAILMLAAGLWPVAGALLGFLAWNWSPAKVFMGDVGSTWLGAVFAGMVLQQTTAWGALSLLLVAFPLLADACLCILRRLQAGQPIFQAHRLHLFQRLQQAGWPHGRVARLYGGATMLLALARVHGGSTAIMPLVAAELLLGMGLDRFQALPFRRSAKNGVG